MSCIIMPAMPGITCANSRPAQKSETAARRNSFVKLLLGDLTANLAARVCRRMDVCVCEAGKEKLLERIAVDGRRHGGACIEEHAAVAGAGDRVAGDRGARRREEVDRRANGLRDRARAMNVAGRRVAGKAGERDVPGQDVCSSIERRRERSSRSEEHTSELQSPYVI